MLSNVTMFESSEVAVSVTLQVLVEAVAQLLHDALSHAVGDVRLEHADRTGDDRDPDHDPDQQLEQGQVRRQKDLPVVGEERSVEDDLDEHRVHHARTGGDHHEEGDGGDAGPVRFEQARRLADQLSIGDAPRGLIAFGAHEAASVHHGSSTPGHRRVRGVIASTVPSR